MATRTVTVRNVSIKASERDVRDFFSFSGEIVHVEIHGESDASKIAYVTFKDTQGAETAALLSGATIVDQPVTISLTYDYKLPDEAWTPPNIEARKKDAEASSPSSVKRAEDVVSGMLAKGFILGKDALNKAKSFDEKHRLTSTASATVSSLDQKIGLTEKINAGTTMVNVKMKEMDQKFQVSEKTKSTFAAAEQTASNAGSALMKNRYVLTGASWVAGAYSKVAKAAEEVGQKAQKKVLAEEAKGGKM